MADSLINQFTASGTTAERTAFTPTPPSPLSGPDPGYTFYDTDLTRLYCWDGAAWQPATVAGAGTVTNTGTLTAGQLIVGNGTVDVTVGNLSGDVTTSGGTATTLKTAAKTRAISFGFNGGGSALTVGDEVDVFVPYACTITAVTLGSDDTGGDVELDIEATDQTGYPGSYATIVASAPPTITGSNKSQDVTLTGWTTAVSAGTWLRFSVTSVTDIVRLAGTLTVTV